MKQDNATLQDTLHRIEAARNATHRGIMTLSINEQDALSKYVKYLETQLEAWLLVPRAYGIMTTNPQSFILSMDRRGEAWERGERPTDPSSEKVVIIQPETVHNVLLLAGIEIPVSEIKTWSDFERKRVATWAAAVHYHASDNEDVVVPVKPEIVRIWERDHPTEGWEPPART